MGAASWPMSVERSWLPKDAGDVKTVGLIDVLSGIEKMNYRIPLLVWLFLFRILLRFNNIVLGHICMVDM